MTAPPLAAEPPIAPERTFALVVGIESYEINTGLDLSGPARDAVRFADWLTGTAGVPQDNLRLLLSPLAGNQAGTAAKPATGKNVMDALFEDLPRCDGDLLWIYWAGHGFLDPQHQLLLPYADATAGATTPLNLTSALHWWRSSRVRRGRFRHLVAIGDACRIDTRQAKLDFVKVEYPVGLPTPQREQFVLYAARPGETARNLTELQAGLFTDTLLKRLEDRSAAEAVRDLVGIAQAVQGDFAMMKANGTAWQEPQFEIARSWDGSPLYGDHWTDSTAPVGAPALDHTAWKELGQVLTGCQTPSYTYEAYRWAFEVTGCVPPAEHKLPSPHLTEIVRDLDHRQGTSRAVPLALPFIQHLASRSRRPEWAADAQAWVDRTLERLGADPLPPAPPQPAERPALHIRLTPDGDDDFWLQLWSYQDRFENVGDYEEPMGLAAVRTVLGNHLLAHRASMPQRIEFHVPYELLEEPFETWQVPTGRGDRTTPLGCRYEVVLRCPEERLGLAEDPWRTKWEWYETHGGRHPDAVHEVGDADVAEGLADELQLDASPVCVLADVTGPLVMDALGAVLDGGIPIAVWPRSSPAPDESLRKALGAEEPDVLDVAALPDALRRLRVKRRPLALLWDDPGRVPARRSLSS
ncbi:caspase family protein [Streptomyces cinnabarinus]|uniref:Caspase family protein n=1 Tax=Streptomyces cinnabarinus TaxID=67287 RepID=A0ABY7KT19_9ACTN|nr:caspase family protein [Streptomyces cinnabarinus]WAZ26014.1 caspase family protein [Streptomyces cinnabarinus]